MVAGLLCTFADEGADGTDDGREGLRVGEPPGVEVGFVPVGDEAGAEGRGEDVA